MSGPDSVFRDELTKRMAGQSSSRPVWLYVHEDQLTDQLGTLGRAKPQTLGIVLVEHRWKASLRPYHQHRLALIWSNQRQFALEQAARGVMVRYEIVGTALRDALPSIARAVGSPVLEMMAAAEWETREDIKPLVAGGLIRVEPHEGWLTTRGQFDAANAGLKGSPRWKMDSFYRHVRKESGVLMENGAYVGGKVSFDTENRQPWTGRLDEPKAPTPPVFAPGAVTREVVAMVRSEFKHHPGAVHEGSLATTLEDAERLWAWAKSHCLEHFGAFEDAMSVRSRGVFHTRISPLLNLQRILAREVVEDVEAMDIPLASKEGFIRQVLGWREFVRHVHDATDGFRSVGDVAPAAGDGGFARWAGRAWAGPKDVPFDVGGALTHAVGGAAGLPPTYWGKPSGMHCLDHVVGGVWAEAWSHHITRLMVLSNIATLLDVDSRELTDWFWVAYADAWDWVVEPNVMAMGTYSTGDVMTTKPYISGSAYIDKMSDYCEGCTLDPKSTCPITRLYWAFLARHEGVLKGNGRMMMPMRSLAKRAPGQRAADARVFVAVRDVLVRGERVTAGLVERAAGETP